MVNGNSYNGRAYDRLVENTNRQVSVYRNGG